MLVEEATEFLKKGPSFQFLDVPALKDITDDVTMEFLSKGVPTGAEACLLMNISWSSRRMK
jgi:hypothetical protein